MSADEVARGQAGLVSLFAVVLRQWKTGRARVTVGGDHSGLEDTPFSFSQSGVYDDRCMVFGNPLRVHTSLDVSYTPGGDVFADDAPELSRKEALAVAVLASDDRAAASALADFLQESGVDFVTAAKEEAVREERERVAREAEAFRKAWQAGLVDSVGGLGVTSRDALIRSALLASVDGLRDMADFLAYGKTFEEWREQERLRHLLQFNASGMVSNVTVWDEYASFTTEQMEAIIRGFGIPPELAGIAPVESTP